VSDAEDPAPDDVAGPCPTDFDETVYLELNPDVAAAVSAGALPSGEAHYLRYGAREGRRYLPASGEVREPVVIAMATLRPDGSRAPPPPAFGVEAVRMSPGGGVFVTGWVDDATDPLAELFLEGDGWGFDLAQVSLARTRRRDVEERLAATGRYPYGFWSFLDLGRELPRHAACRLRLRLESGAGVTLEAGVRGVPDADLRDTVLASLAGADHFGDPYAAAVACLDGGTGAQLVANNRRLTAEIVAEPFVERFGPQSGKIRGSLVVCLYGRPEFLFVQNALFAGLPGIADYEFVYVCNSPDLADRLLRDARIASLVHGARQTLVLLPGNAGFSAANNVGVAHAQSDRVVALNPDVVPRQPDWARRHTEAVASLPPAQTDLFGVPLHYEDGSLMHGGMFFEIDSVPVEGRQRLLRRDLVRVEHYGKGAPPDAKAFTRARPVPAATGAFLSFRRGWFERLGGFSENFVFGGYEDADLCLRSLMAGTPAWLHDIRLWHLEGKGGLRPASVEGANFVNRWQFSRAWAGTIRNGLLGPAPTHTLLAAPPAPAPTRKRKAAP
jgi:GT2 family glycosyltransferase